MRKSWDEYFIDIAKQAATRSTCLRSSVGAVIVDRNNIILSTGYNGAPSGISHCDIVGCKRAESKSRQNLEDCIAIHAEQNAILQALNKGLKIKNTTMYVTKSPCTTCCKLIAQSKVSRIVISDDYISNKISLEILRGANIEIEEVE